MIRPVEVEYMNDYKCRVWFSNGESGVVDFSFVFNGSKMYEKIRDLDMFTTIHVSEDGMCIEWDNGVDVCPDTTYAEMVK